MAEEIKIEIQEGGVGVPSGGTTGQVLKKKSDTSYDTEWSDDEGGSSTTWGNITGSISNQSDLQSELDAKLDDSQLIDDDTFATATSNNIPSAESVKAYVDANSSNGHTIQESGVDVTDREKLNFKGAVTVDDNAANNSTDVTFQINGGLSPNNVKETLSATGGETTWVLSETPTPSSTNMLFRGSAYIPESEYNLSGNTLTLSGLAIPSAGEKLYFIFNKENTNYINHPEYPIYADNSAAIAGGLEVNDVYKTSTGALYQVYETSIPTNATFIMIGDSITEDVFSDTSTMKSKVESEYSGTTVEFFEEGTDGIRATTVDDQIATILNGITPTYPSNTYVVVTLGTNDVNDLRPYSGASQASLDAYSDALDTILDEIESRGYTPILNEIYYANYDASTFNNQEVGTKPFNDNIVHSKILNRTPDFAYNDGVSFYQSYNMFYNNRDTWFVDSLHPNATGVSGFQDHFVNTIAYKIFTGNDPIKVAIDNTDSDQDGNPITTDPNDSVAQTANDSFNAQAEVATTYNILANDDFLPSADVTIVDLGTGTASGTVSFNNLTGEITYTSTAGEEDTSVTVDYRVTYVPTGVSGDATITINVTGSFDSDVQAYISAVGTLSGTEESAYNDLISGLKTDGLWSKTIALYSLVNGSEEANKWNIKDPRDLDAAYRITWNGTLTTNANGMTSDGSTGYGNTHLTYQDHTSTNFAYGFYSGTNTSLNGGYEMGSNDFGNSVRLDIISNDNHEFLTQGAFVSDVATNSLGMFIGTRTSSTDMRLLKNGVLLATDTTSDAPTPSTLELYLLCINQNGSAFNFSNIQGRMVFITQGLTTTEAQNYTTRIETFLDALGKGVVN